MTIWHRNRRGRGCTTPPCRSQNIANNTFSEGWLQKSNEFAGLRTAPATHHAKNTANTTFSCGMLQNAGFGTIPCGGGGGGGSEPRTGIIYRYMQKFIAMFWVFWTTVVRQSDFWSQCRIDLLPLGSKIAGSHFFSHGKQFQNPEKSHPMNFIEILVDFHRIGGSLMVILSSWWLNQPNRKICSPNWILFPKESTTYSYSAYKSKRQCNPQCESTNQVIWHADFCKKKNGRFCSDPYDINWTLKHRQSSYSKRGSISTKNLLVTVLWNFTVPVYGCVYIIYGILSSTISSTPQ